MEIIEKQVEKTKEVPYGYWENCGYGGYGYGRNVNGKANAGLTLGIIGTVLGGAALLGRRNGFSLFGNSGTDPLLQGLWIRISVKLLRLWI